ncbi:MAG: sporulation peptidase YabG [Bacilli bacterium]
MSKKIEVNDLVTRNSYNNDVIFKVVEIEEDNATLKGVIVRLLADSPLSDLKSYEKDDIQKQLTDTLNKVKVKRK